jgi:succinate-semialdehyde dehydrogenase/glutarate-semialdehyde dehydrogenase
MLLSKEEIFGPISAITSFSTEEEAVSLANDTEFGLASYIYTKNNARIHRVTEALQYGMVGVNTGIISYASAPFGGIKESGFGREGSKYGIDEYLILKYICTDIK